MTGPAGRRPQGLDLQGTHIEAVILDMDGVITDTASVHAAVWKKVFDGFLRERADRIGQPFDPFDIDRDYRLYVDGKARYDGVQSFLASRNIRLPRGDPTDPPDRPSVCGLGNQKNAQYQQHLLEHGAKPYPSTVKLVRELRRRGIKIAAISASRNMSAVLDAAGVADLFDTTVDGVVADELGLRGKPDPAMFEEAARRLRVDPSRAAIFEDALAGVAAGRRSGFGLVVGVDRTGHPDALVAAGADVVVDDLAEIQLQPPDDPLPSVGGLPLALDHVAELRAMLAGRAPAVFLDYDGTLTPIVERPEDAVLSPGARAAIQRLAGLVPVAVLSGRDLRDVRRMVGVERIAYAGSHGFDLVLPDGASHQKGRESIPELDAAEAELESRLRSVTGARVERKAFAIAVHFRQVDPERVTEVEARLEEVATAHPRLRRTGGKKIFELRPGIDWNKGEALRWLLEVMGLAGADVLPVYVGDDETDEDAFRAVRIDGLGVVVRGENDDRPTVARLALRDTEEARAFLELIADAVSEGDPA